jgi:PPK2 family polyphosphate:nucleotide phosphotransferase
VEEAQMSEVAHVNIREYLRVPAGDVDLSIIDPRSTPRLPATKEVQRDPKGWSREQVSAVGIQLASLQERLYAAARGGSSARLLLLLQAMDCGGKDGTIKNVAGAMNPLGLKVVSFGKPTPEEQRHHFLWRIRRNLPTAGYVGVFNRSQYEDVLVVRVHDLAPRAVWSKRYDEINRFEVKLVADGLTMIKVMLHISPEEQKKRLMERLTDPTKYWKYNPADVDERSHWDEYMAAYAVALSRCNTDAAPWYVVPADRKWYRNWAVAHLVWETLDELDPKYPEPEFDPVAELARLRAAK